MASLVLTLCPRLLLVAVALRLPACCIAQTTTRVSVTAEGGQVSGHSYLASISGEGRFVAFVSYASDLVPDDTNGFRDIFVHDRLTGRVEMVSVSSDGAQANGESFYPSISADGRYVAFDSVASNLVANDTNGTDDVFIHDRLTGKTELISVESGEMHGPSHSPRVASDGRYVLFNSGSPSLVPGDTNGVYDVFVYDRAKRSIGRVSISSTGEQGNAESTGGSISADGRYVAFISQASNLVPGDTNDASDVFMRDLVTETTERIAISSSTPMLSADGRSLVFATGMPLVQSDTNHRADVYVMNRLSGVVELVSVSQGGAVGGPSLWFPAISTDGRSVLFDSDADTLVPNDVNERNDVFLRDRVTGTTDLASVSSAGAQGESPIYRMDLSADGRWVTWDSQSSRYSPGDSNAELDVFVRGPMRPLETSVATLPAPVQGGPAVINGVAYVGADDGKLYAVNTLNHLPVAGFPVDLSAVLGARVKLPSRPAVYTTAAGTSIYLTSDQGHVVKLHGDGRLAWHVTPLSGSTSSTTPAVMPDGSLYAALSDDTGTVLVRLDGEDGHTLKSSRRIDGTLAGSPSVHGGRVYLPLSGGLVVLGALDLTELAAFKSGEKAFAPYVLGRDTFVSTQAGWVYKVNGATLTLQTGFADGGRVDLGHPASTGPFAGTDRLYIGTADGKVMAVDAASGDVRLLYDVGSITAVGELALNSLKDMLAFGTADGRAVRVPIEMAEKARTTAISGPLSAAPSFDLWSGRFFFTSAAGGLSALPMLE